MESLLTSTAEILVIGFALLMAIDFFCGLVQLYLRTPSQTELHAEPQPEGEMPVRACPSSIASSIGQLTVLPENDGEPQAPTPLAIAGWDVVEPVGDKPATLDWLSTAIKPDTLNAADQPNIIEMARLSLLKAEVIGGGREEIQNKVESLYQNSLLAAKEVGVVEGCPQYCRNRCRTV